MPLPEHLSRHRCAGLFLDTLPYNAHTTASDALWAGLPVLTCAGQSFAARVAASLLTALDMRELIVADLEAYENLAVSLAQDPRRHEAVVQKLARNRLTSSLFDGEKMARILGAAYKLMMARHDNNLAPDHIFISSDTG
jgi:protein O-GlcNAc transferase